MRAYVHPNAVGSAPFPPLVLVRPAWATWALPLLMAPLLLVSLVLPWASAADRVPATAMAGALFAGSLALATSRWEAQGPFLVGVGCLAVHCVAASHVAAVEQGYGIEIVRVDGSRLSLGALVYRHHLAPGGRAAERVAREADAVRARAAAHRHEELPVGARSMTVDPRWATVGGVLLSAVLAPALSIGLAAL